MAGVSPRLVVRDTRGWGESQAGRGITRLNRLFDT